MKNYLLLMRGVQSNFIAMSESEKMEIIQAHKTFAKSLNALGALVDGNGLSNETQLLSIENGNLKSHCNPFANTTNELSGYYIIKCENIDEAVEIAKKCPALSHDESVEIVPMGHE